MSFLRMDELDLTGKRVMIREDFNVPLDAGKVTSDARLRAALPTIQMALDGGAALILLSHLGRPVEGQYEEKFSMAPVAEHLSGLIGKPVRLQKNWLDGFDISPVKLCCVKTYASIRVRKLTMKPWLEPWLRCVTYL